MTAIKTANIIEGNLATEPKYFPKGQYVARLVFRIMHTDRKLNQQTGQWEDGRTTAVDVTSTARPRNVTRRPSSSSPTCSPREPPWSHGASCPTVPTYGLTATAPHSPRPSSTARASSPTSSSTSVVPIASNPIPPACRNTPTRSRNRTRGRDNRHRPEPSRTATGGRSTMTAPSIRMKKGTWKWNASKPLI